MFDQVITDPKPVTDLHVCHRLQALVMEIEDCRAAVLDILERERMDPCRRMLMGTFTELKYEVAQWANACKRSGE